MKTKIQLWAILPVILLFFPFYHSSAQDPAGSSYLEINNVKALFNPRGLHFFKPDTARYEVPKGSGIHSNYSQGLWVGGKDAAGNLHLAGARYGQGPDPVSNALTQWDYYCGPVMYENSYSAYQDSLWTYIWNLRKSEIDYHKIHYNDAGYVPVHDILTWPGNGDTLLGQAWHLAPFFDMNSNGIYEPLTGDYPLVRGDQALYFIFNDARGSHVETEGVKLGIEIHGMAYAFDIESDSALKNTTFLFYRIYNRSSERYDSAYLGLWDDFDLGYPSDDFLGCNVERSTFYCYNGKPEDNGLPVFPACYGANPPIQTCTLLAGPLMDPDGIDNPKFDNYGNPVCGYGINGTNFGDEIADNERYGLTGFASVNNFVSGVPYFMTDPMVAADYYQLLLSEWKDGQPMTYGGNGHPSAGGIGPECRFMYPADSDTLNWGTECLDPSPANKYWTEATAANNPSDRRGLGVTGPFTFYPGTCTDLELAFIWSRDYDTLDNSSMNKMLQMVDQVKQYYITNTLPNGGSFLVSDGNEPIRNEAGLKIRPNPANTTVTVEVPVVKGLKELQVLNGEGKVVRSIAISGTAPVKLDVSSFAPGFYIVKVISQEKILTGKLIVE